MNTERLMLKGQLSQLQKEAEDLKIKIKGLRSAMRVQLYEFTPPEDIQEDVVAEQALSLSGAVISLRETLQKIQAIKKALG